MFWGPMDRLFGSLQAAGADRRAATAAVARLSARWSERCRRSLLVAWFAIFGLCQRLRPGADRARPVAVSAPSGRPGADASSTWDRWAARSSSQLVSGFVIELFPAAADGAYPLDAYRAVFGLQAAFILLASSGLFACARSRRSRRKRARTFVPLPSSGSRYARWVNIPYFSPCLLCGAVAYCCGAVAPRVTAALLGRFLPRLGPLASRERPFFLVGLIGRGACSALPIVPCAVIPPRPDRAAAPRAESRPGARPALPDRRPARRMTASARSAARPCRARG